MRKGGKRMADYIWGRYPVLEALRSRRRVHRVLVAQGPRDPALTQVIDQARRVGVTVETVSRRHLDDLTGGAIHQGILAQAAPREYAEIDDMLARAQELGEPPLVVVLGCNSGCAKPRLADPHGGGGRRARRGHPGASRRRADARRRQNLGGRSGVSAGRTCHQYYAHPRRPEKARTLVCWAGRRSQNDARSSESQGADRAGRRQ